MDPFEFEKRVQQLLVGFHTEIVFLLDGLNKFYDRVERTDVQVVNKLSFAERATAVENQT